MNWIITSCIIVISSTGLYLTLRSIERYKTPLKIKSLAMFAAPLLPLLLFNIHNKTSLLLGIQDVIILFFTAIFFSWFANMASLRALEYSPNPWYPLIIGKSYVIYTTLFSIFLLWSEFSLFKILLIILIILFSTCVLLEKKNEKKRKSWSWLAPTIYTFFAWGNLALILAYLSQTGISASILNLYLLWFVTIFILWEIIFQKQSYTPKSRWEVYHIIAIGIFFIAFQQSMVYGYTVAPNPGYINAVNVWSIGLVTLFSVYLFGDHINLQKAIWIWWIMVCLVLLFL